MIYQLQENSYQECDRSPTFPLIKKEDLYRFLQLAQQDEIEAEKYMREWVREKVKSIKLAPNQNAN